MSKASMAIVILTKNEERNIASCIKQHRQHCDVYVLDSGSTDKTRAIAKSLGATVLTRSWTGFADQRNFAIDALGAQYDWLMFIDADEQFDPAVFSFVDSTAEKSDVDVIYVSQTIYLNDKPLRHAPGYPIYHPRIARTSRARFSQNQSGHGEMIDSTRGLNTHFLDIPYRHYITSHGIQHWLTKHVGLAALESNQLKQIKFGTTRRMRLSLLVPNNLLRPFIRFLYHYLVRGGFRDGRPGLVYSTMYAWFELTKWLIRNESQD